MKNTKVKITENIGLFQTATQYSRLFSKAVQKAQQENKEKGINNVYVYNGKTFYETPEGEMISKAE